MKKTGKKFLSILLAVMMVLSVLAPAAFAQETAPEEVPQTEPVREYIYEVLPLYGFRVEEGTTEDQVKEMLKEKYPTATVKGSQNGTYQVPITTWYIYERYNRFEVTGYIETTDYPNLIKKESYPIELIVSKGNWEMAHITDAQISVSEDITVPFGTSFSEVGLPSTATVSFDGQEETEELNLSWSDYSSTYVGTQRLVATLNVPKGSSKDCDRNWRWEINVTVLPPEGISSIEASEMRYTMPCVTSHSGDPTLETATVVLDDGSEHELPISWDSTQNEVDESILCEKTTVSVPGSRRWGTVDLSSLEGFGELAHATAIFEVAESRAITARTIVSASEYDNTWIPEYNRGLSKKDISEALNKWGGGETNIVVEVGGQQIPTTCDIRWDAEVSEIDPDTSGEYTLKGFLDLSNNDFLDPSHLSVTRTIKITDKSFILHEPVKSGYVADVSVEAGTTKAALQNKLDAEFGTVEIWDTWQRYQIDVSVNWDVESSNFTGEKGIYIITGSLNLEGRSLLEPKSISLKARIAIDTPLKKVSSIEVNTESMSVSYGTSFTDLGLPDKAKVTFADESESPAFLDISWSTYYPTWVGSQIIRGTVELPSNYDLSTYSKEVMVTVGYPEGITSYNGKEQQSILRITTPEQIEKLLAYGDYLPETSTVVLEDGSEHELPISWDNTFFAAQKSFIASNESYYRLDPCYYVKGTVDFSTLSGFEDTASGTVLFEFKEEWNSYNNQALSVDSTDDLHVERGTTANEVQTMLSTQCPELRVYVDSETYPVDRVCPIIWNVSGSNYNRFIEGTYTVYGEIDLSNTDVEMKYREVKARANVVVGSGGTPIVSVKKATDVVVASPFYTDLISVLQENAPKATVILQDKTEREIPVSWDIMQARECLGKGYGTYTITGILDFSQSSDMSNPQGLHAEIDLRYEQSIYISSNPQLGSMDIGIGTTKETLKKVLENEYPTATYSDYSTGDAGIVLPVIWDASKFEFDGQTPGTYTVYGDLDLTGTVHTNYGNHQAQVEVTVKDYPTIVSDAVVTPKTYEPSEITAEQLQVWLNTTYPTLPVTVSNETEKQNWNITWDVASSGFNGEEAGTYTVCGTIQIPEDSTVQNPGQYQAMIEVSVIGDKGNYEVVSVETDSISLEQNIYLSPLSKKFELSGTPMTVTPPETATVTLDNGSTAQLAVNWHVEDFDPYKVTGEGEAPQKIMGDLVIPEDSDISNPDEIQAQLDVTVTPMTYRLASAKSSNPTLEVYKGTTMEELNEQLQAEGKDEVSITGTNSRNVLTRTFSKVFLEESNNADWATKKDLCGTYELTASWPENIGMRTPTRPVILKVNVTVKEPLEILSTKTAHMDMYQGVDPANAENIPQTVTAVLSDDSEVEVGVEWDWSFFNKNNLSNPPILGHLKDFPKCAKQPANEEITASMTLMMIPVTYTIQNQTGTNTITTKAGLTLEEITALSQQEGSEFPEFSRTFHLSGTAEDYKTVTADYTAAFTLTDEENPSYSPTSVGSHTLTVSMTLPDYIDTSKTPGYNAVTLITEPVTVSNIEPVNTIDREGTAFAELTGVPDQVLATLDVAGPDGIAKTAWLSVNWNTESYNPLPEGITEDTPVTQTVTGTLANVPAYIQAGSITPTLSVKLGREFDILSISPIQTEVKEVKLGTSFAEVNSMVSHEALLTLRCTNGTTTTQTISFELLAEDNLSYDAMTVGTYSLQGRLSVGENVKNPDNLSILLTVRTVKYSLVESYVPEEDIFMFVGEDPLDYLPATISALLSNGETEDLPVIWDMNTIDAEISDFYEVTGAFDLPIYLENPKDVQAYAFVFVDEPGSQILSMTQLANSGSGMRKVVAKQAKVISGYTAHRYQVKRLYEDGTVKEQVMTLYLKNQ